MVMLAQPCECSKTTEVYTLKGQIFMVGELDLNLKKNV